MNPSYNSGGLGNSGVKPGVIASGPDTPAPSPMQPSSPMPLSGGRNKRPRKGLIIGGILAIVVLIVVIVVAMLIPKGGNNGGGQSQVVATQNEDFLKYANYLLNGKENANVNLGSYDATKIYAVTDAFNKEDTSFFEKLNNLWTNFYDPIAKNEEILETSDLRGSTDWQNELMDFVVKYVEAGDFDDEELLNLYTKNGLEGAISEVDKTYENLLKTTYTLGAEYATALADNAKAMLNTYSEYSKYGCIVNGAINEGCVDSNLAALSSVEKTYYENVPELNDQILNDAVEMLIENCFVIKDSLNE